MDEKLKNLKESLRGDLSEYKPFPFWSWNNEIEEKELIRQIESRYKSGLGGFMIHGRTGVKTE